MDVLVDNTKRYATKCAKLVLKDQKSKLLASGLNSNFNVMTCKIEILTP